MNNRPAKLCGTGYRSYTDILSVGLQMPRRLRQEMPFVTFHLLSDTPPSTDCYMTYRDDTECWRRLALACLLHCKRTVYHLPPCPKQRATG